jgi:hypothetical protein
MPSSPEIIRAMDEISNTVGFIIICTYLCMYYVNCTVLYVYLCMSSMYACDVFIDVNVHVYICTVV